jgi:type II secretory pathway component PulJ
MKVRSVAFRKGFTLSEAIVASSLLVVISAIMLSFLIQGANLWQLMNDQSDLRSVGRIAMNYMTQELRKTTRDCEEDSSVNLVIPSKPENKSVHFYLPVDSDTDNNDLIIDDFGVTEWDKSNKIEYKYVPGLKRLRRIEKGNQYTIADDVESIEFEDKSINPDLYDNELKIILTLQKLTAQNRTASVTLTSIVKLRTR